MNRDDREIIPIFIGMKCLNFCLAVFFCSISSSLFAQTPQQIEADLVKSFKKIDYWMEKGRDTSFDTLIASDSLDKANEGFAKKLKHYSEKNPAIINYPFKSLGKEGPAILSSSDGLFRIYSWDTWTGGTMHVFENVLQYKSGGKIVNIIDTAKNEEDNIYTYEDVYTFRVNNKTYYLTTYLGIFSNKDSGRGIRIFDIEKGKLNKDVKLIKTASGMHGHLYYDYDFFSVVDTPFKNRPTITFDNATNTISLPLVDRNHKVTNKFILYKFTGQYFERVKN